jgi:hypothetical protein
VRDALKNWPWHALAFAVYPLLHLAVTNPGQADPAWVALSCVVAATAAASLVAAMRLSMQLPAAGASAAWIILLFFAYGPINEWWIELLITGIERSLPGIGWFASSAQLLHSLVWLSLAWGGLVLLRRNAARIGPRLTGSLNVASGLLIAFMVTQGAWNATRDGAAAGSTPATASTGAGTATPADRPDIYIIVLDGYARADVLQQYYGYDNTPFLSGLRERGFQVSDASQSNYAWTFLALSSMLNFDYVQPLLGDRLTGEGVDRSAVYGLLRDNAAARFLKSRGYQTVQLQSTWGGTGKNEEVDQFIPCHAGVFANEYLRAVADASWLRVLASKASMDIANCHLKNFESLGALASRPGPKFVFAHFLPPHHPYLFDRDGNIQRQARISDQFEFQKRLWEDRAGYLDQLLFMNRRISEVIDRILADTPKPPVILLVSDHGPNIREGLRKREQRRIRLANLTAAYLPNAPDGTLPADATPVNHLRRVFNVYFDAGLPLRRDRRFASSFEKPFELIEVEASGCRMKTQGVGFDKM